ncbi:cysteine dioxygenase [Cellulomonas sp. NPDC055163]
MTTIVDRSPATAPTPPPPTTRPPGSARTLRLTELAALTRSLAERPDLWRPLVRFDQGSRWWTRLEGPAGTDVWLLSWLTSQGTELHDHGPSAAAFTVVRGALTENRPGGGDTLASRTFAAGRTQTVVPGAVHDVVNVHAEPAVSIHAYSPPLLAMTYYTLGGGGLTPTRTVLTDQPEQDA